MDCFNAVLLVDDDEATNFYHQIVLEEWGKAKNVYVAANGEIAINFLKEHDSFRYQRPSLILLDVNMPVMNGFEFLAAYSQLDEELKASIVVVMLTTSLHPNDQNQAHYFKELRGYLNKPLTIEQLEGILKQALSANQ
jgi:CheY-like chemotaxis protein